MGVVLQFAGELRHPKMSVVDDEKNTSNDLSYLEGRVLRGIAQSGEGVVSTYFDDYHLIHQSFNLPLFYRYLNHES